MPVLPRQVVHRLLDTWPIARLATVRRDGRPHMVPIVFAHYEQALWSPIDGKPKRDGAPLRIQNIRHDPRVAVLLDQYDSDWSRLWWVRVDGQASVVMIEASDKDSEAGRALGALRDKYPQYADTPVLGPQGLLIRIRGVTVRSWCADPNAVDLS